LALLIRPIKSYIC